MASKEEGWTVELSCRSVWLLLWIQELLQALPHLSNSQQTRSSVISVSSFTSSHSLRWVDEGVSVEIEWEEA